MCTLFFQSVISHCKYDCVLEKEKALKKKNTHILFVNTVCKYSPRKSGSNLLLKIHGFFCTWRHSTRLQPSKSAFIFSRLWQKFWEKHKTLFALPLISKVVCFTSEGGGVRHVAPDYRAGLYYCVLNNRLHEGNSWIKNKTSYQQQSTFNDFQSIKHSTLITLLCWYGKHSVIISLL